MSRRMFLQGSGGTLLTIPFLSSLLPREAWAQSMTPPKRYIGMVATFDYGHAKAWFPTNGILAQTLNVPGHSPIGYQSLRSLLGSSSRMSTMFGPGLNSHLDSINLFRGLDIIEYFGHGFAHGMGNLAAVQNNPLLYDLPSLQTIDQVLGRNARINPKASEPYLMTNYADTHSFGPNSQNQISFMPTNASSPGEMFNTLFRGGALPESGQTSQAHPRRDVLSRVMEDYQRIRSGRQISSIDKVVLDNALDKIAEVQRNIAAQTQLNMGCTYKGVPRAYDGRYFDSANTLRNMADLTVAAMQCDINRVFHFTARVAEEYYNKSITDFHGGHTHEPLLVIGGKANWEYIAEVQAQFVTNFIVPLLNGMSAAIDAQNGKSILYNSLVHYTLEHGMVHSMDSIPAFLAGNAGGAVTTGYMLDYMDRALTAQDNTALSAEGGWTKNPNDPNWVGTAFGIPYNRIYNTIFQAMGMEPSEYERTDINQFFVNRTDSVIGAHNNGIARVGGYGYVGAQNPTQADSHKYGRRYNKYKLQYFKDVLPLPPTNA